MHPDQHLRDLRRHSVMDRRGGMERIMPEILLQLKTADIIESAHHARVPILLAIIRRVPVEARLGVGFGVVDDLGEEGVGVELEDGGVEVVAGEVGREGGEAGVPVCDGAGRDGVAPFAGEGHAVERGDVEEEEVAGAGGVELFFVGGEKGQSECFEIGRSVMDGWMDGWMERMLFTYLLEQESIDGE